MAMETLSKQISDLALSIVCAINVLLQFCGKLLFIVIYFVTYEVLTNTNNLPQGFSDSLDWFEVVYLEDVSRIWIGSNLIKFFHDRKWHLNSISAIKKKRIICTVNFTITDDFDPQTSSSQRKIKNDFIKF